MPLALPSVVAVTLGRAERESFCSRWVLSLIVLSLAHLPPAAAPCRSPPPHRFLHTFTGAGSAMKDRSQKFTPQQPNRQPNHTETALTARHLVSIATGFLRRAYRPRWFRAVRR